MKQREPIEAFPAVHVFYTLIIPSALPWPSRICLVSWQSRVHLVHCYCHYPHLSLFRHMSLSVVLSGTVVFWKLMLGGFKKGPFYSHCLPGKRVCYPCCGPVPVCFVSKTNCVPAGNAGFNKGSGLHSTSALFPELFSSPDLCFICKIC